MSRKLRFYVIDNNRARPPVKHFGEQETSRLPFWYLTRYALQSRSWCDGFDTGASDSSTRKETPAA